MDSSPFSLSAYVGDKFDKPKKHIMSIEEYKAQPFKTDGECKPIPISDIWLSLSRRARREIERLIKKGKNPDIVDYL